MQSDRQARIRERAYHIWVEEGRSEGRHDEHWQRAEREIAEEEARAGDEVAAPPRRPRPKSPEGSEAQEGPKGTIRSDAATSGTVSGGDAGGASGARRSRTKSSTSGSDDSPSRRGRQRAGADG